MTAENQILAILPPNVLQRLEPHLDVITFSQGDIVHRPGDPLSYLYFPLDCLFSIIITMGDGSTAEVGVVGNRDVLGINTFMGTVATTQTQYVVQIAGKAKRVDARIVRAEFDRNGEFRDVLLRYTQAFLVQVSQTAACNSLHVLEQRLARWLLGTQERINSNTIPLTQEFIAIMLGVRRAGVTLAAQKLQERKLIQYRRGSVQILDQVGLEAFACECFKTIQTEYNRLLGDKPKQHP